MATSNILKLVAGMFNGAPGGAILNDLSGAVNAGMSLPELADILENTNQFQSLVGNLDTAGKVEFLMNNFGLTPNGEAGSPAARAQNFFTNSINDGVGLGQMVYQALVFLESDNLPEEFAEIAALMNNKALVAEVHAAHHSTIANVAAGQALFVGVTSTFPSTPAEALEHVQNIVGPGNGGVPGETFTLTSGVDDLVGTANNDTFNAPIFQSGADFLPTLQSVDSIDGGAGTDTLNLQLHGIAGIGNNGALGNVVSNIEIWNIRNFSDTAGSILNLANVDSIQQLWNNRSAHDLTLNNVAAAATIGMHRVAEGTTYTVSYTNDALGGNDEAAQAVAFSSVGDAEAGAAATLNVTAGGADVITNLNASVTGANDVALGAGLNTVTNLTLSGDGSIVLRGDNDFAVLESLDASALTGTLDIQVADTVLDGENTLVGGQASDDVLRINDINAVDLSQVSGFEVLGIGGAVDGTGGVSLDISGTGFSSLIFGNVGTGGSLDLLGVADGGSVTFEGNFIDAVDLSFDTEGAVAVNFANDSGVANSVGTITGDDLTALTLDATATDLGVTIAGITQDDPDTAMMAALTVNVGEGDFDLGTLDLANLTTLTVNGSLTDDDGDHISGSFDVVIDGSTPSKLSTIDLSGYNTDATGSVATIDASAANFAGAVTIRIGEGDIAYNPDLVAGRRETFRFVGDDIGDVTIGTGFSTSVTGDRLDFSGFANVTGFDNLSINISGGNAVISAAGDEFEGSITLTGVIDINTLEANSFVF